jgi:signal transduction histidine kinase
VVREVAALTRLAGGPAVAAVHVRAPDRAYAAITAESLKQVLLNLVQNARDARPVGLVLELDVDRDDDTTSIAVADNGPGVPAAILASVFEPFFTTRGSSGGMGLGLFVVESLVRGHGGTVALDTPADGGGSRFIIDIPSAAEPAAAANARVETAGASR